MLIVGLLDELPKVHVPGVVLVGGALSEDHVARARAVDDLFLLAGVAGVVVEPALLPIGLGPQRVDPSRMVGGFYRARVREREQLFRDAEAEQRVTELGVLS